MHILIIPGEGLNPENTFDSIFEINQGEALKRLGHTVGFASFKMKGTIFQLIKRPLKSNKRNFIPKHSFFSIRGMNAVESSNLYAFPSFLNLMDHEASSTGLSGVAAYVKRFGKPDIIHAHSRFLIGALIGFKASKKFNIPFVFTEHSSFHQRKMVSKRDYNFYANIVNFSKSWIVVSSSLGEAVLDNLNDLKLCTNKHFQVVPNVLDQIFEDADLVAFENRKFVFLIIARLDNNKNHLHLLQAFKLLTQVKDNVYLRIIGSGENLEMLLNEAKLLKIEHHVQFLGHLDRHHVKQQIAHSHVGILASKKETFGVSLIESLAMGKPIISTDSGGPRQIVKNSNGILVDPQNREKLFEAMNHIIENYHFYDATQIKQDCIANFGFDAISQRLALIYTEAIQKQN